MYNQEIKVGIADMKMARQEGVLITHALGSCIGIVFWDKQIKLGAMVHIMLPEATAGATNKFKFGDTGVEETLKKLAVFGGQPSRYMCKIAGGAQMFPTGGNAGSLGNIGQRNIESVKAALLKAHIPIVREDVGKNFARTMSMDVATGEVKIRMAGGKEYPL